MLSVDNDTTAQPELQDVKMEVLAEMIDLITVSGEQTTQERQKKKGQKPVQQVTMLVQEATMWLGLPVAALVYSTGWCNY